MAGFENYSYLPGHIAEFKDGNLNLPNDPVPAGTESVLLLGTATDGPVLQPVAVTPETAPKIFGKMANENGVPNGTTLLSKFEEVWAAGCRDVRLMRVTGKTASLEIGATSYMQANEKVNQEILGNSKGNAEQLFILPNGGIDKASVVVYSAGNQLPTTTYAVEGGTASDLSVETDPEVKGNILLNADVTNQEAEISISYLYDYIDADGIHQIGEVTQSVFDSNAERMIAKGEDQVFDLEFKAKAGLRLYADGSEVVNNGIYNVDISNPEQPKLVIHSNAKIKIGALLEVSYAHDLIEKITPSIVLNAIYGGEVYNETKVEVVTNNGIVIVRIEKPAVKKAQIAEPALEFKSSDYPTFQLLVNAINSHSLNNVVRATTSYDNQASSTIEEKVGTFLTGGSSEVNLSKEELFVRLGGERDGEGYIVQQGAYQLLENYSVDYVIPLGVYADDQLVGRYDNFAYQLAMACAVMSHYNKVTNGLISTSSPANTDLRAVEDHVKKLEALGNSYFMRDRVGNEIKDADGNRIDLGQFLTVVAGPDLVVSNTRIGLLATNSPATLTGFISTLPIQSAPTNKQLPSALSLRYEFSTSQLNRLAAQRFVTYKMKPTGAVAVTDAMTAAHEGSDYSRLSTVRVVKSAMDQIREVCEPFIGEPNDTANRNAMSSVINKRLDAMVEAKALSGFEFMVIATPQMELMGEAQIQLTLQAPRELRKITTVVSLAV